MSTNYEAPRCVTSSIILLMHLATAVFSNECFTISFAVEVGLSAEPLCLKCLRLGDRVSLPTRGEGFSHLACVQTSTEAYPASYSMGTAGPFPGVKRGQGVTLTTQPYVVPR
jgi:hypothetical protein